VLLGVHPDTQANFTLFHIGQVTAENEERCGLALYVEDAGRHAQIIADSHFDICTNLSDLRKSLNFNNKTLHD
jgi:hypothetical protein